ncbi:MAG: YihY/virulence factor BrkB family protein [bacterium]
MSIERQAAATAARGRSLLTRTVVKAWQDRILGLSAETAFWQLLSLPSLFLALLGALGFAARLIGQDTLGRAETQLLSGFSRAFSPEVVDQLVAPTVDEVLRGGRADIVSVGFVLALWAGSSATATFVNTITIAYGMRDLRGAVRSRVLALWLYLGSIVLGAVLLPMLVLGPSLLVDSVPRSTRDTARAVVDYLYWPASVVLLMGGLTTLYHLAPPRRLPWLRGVPGAVLAMVIFLGGAALLRIYIQFVLDHNTAYGTLATPIAALLFFYVLAFGVLIGAEFNAAIQEMHPAPASRRQLRAARAAAARAATATTGAASAAAPRTVEDGGG